MAPSPHPSLLLPQFSPDIWQNTQDKELKKKKCLFGLTVFGHVSARVLGPVALGLGKKQCAVAEGSCPGHGSSAGSREARKPRGPDTTQYITLLNRVLLHSSYLL